MSATAIRAGRAFVELFLNDDPLRKGLSGVTARLNAWANSVGVLGLKLQGIGLAAFSSLFLAAKHFSNVGSDLLDMSQRTGMSVEALSELGYAAEQSGASLQALEVGTKNLQKNLAAAANGSKGAKQKLAALGLTVADLQNLSPDKQFELIADRIAAIQDPAQRAAAALNIFGKSGTALLPLFANGGQGMRELRAEAQRFGLTMTTEAAQRAEAFGDQLSLLGRVLWNIVRVVGDAVTPTLAILVRIVTEGINAVRVFIQANQGWVVIGLYAAMATIALGSAMMFLAVAVRLATFTFTNLGTLVSVAVSGFWLLAGAARMIGAALLTILTPTGLIIAGITTLVGLLVHFSGVGTAVANHFMTTFAGVGAEFQSAVNGMAAALAAGNLGLAAQIATTLIQIEFERLQLALVGIMADVGTAIYEGIVNASYAVSGQFVDIWAAIQSLWLDGWNFALDAVSIGLHQMVIAGIERVHGLIDIITSIGGYFSSTIAGVDKQLEDFKNGLVEGVQRSQDSGIAGRHQQLDKQTKDRLRGIENDRLANRAALDRDQAAGKADRQGQRDKAAVEREKRLRELQEQLAQQIAAAEQAKAEALKVPALQIPELNSNFGAKIDAAENQQAAAGTFSAAIAGQIGPNNLIQKQLKQLEIIAENTKPGEGGEDEFE